MLCAKARESHVYILGDSLAERVNKTEKVFNTSVLIDPSGRILAKYRKIHLFDVEIGQQLVLKESEFLSMVTSSSSLRRSTAQ